ncbi:1-aminocyclopropane-1-carboxylate deaminase/D-cysteine desulfhydrase [Chitinophaga solisilvae]|uniref:1-aminocyclopropane-1-carboxylate deaminase/D-cysteine desulfhydrase n=1 Tax=Chitinophaga solisilvae TaxID=1233460 RepID=UPI00136ADBD6|nr:pyridoxal-phosphate dependent enzyme [Chitinophaga solisilvae]
MHYSNTTLSPIPGPVTAAMLRLDLLHPEVSGNKWFKLKYNLAAAAAALSPVHIVTFGGAYSNHIAATAVACKEAGYRCTGIIRGERPPVPGHTLQQAQAHGMMLEYVSRETYKTYTQGGFQREGAWVIPEGGHNSYGASGCEEILSILPTADFTHIMCAVGTGTTLAGLINSALPHQQIIGIPVLKGAQYLENEITKLLHPGARPSWQLLHNFHGGGYAKTSPALIDFINTFYKETGIPTDIIYTGKLVMAFHELSRQRYFPDTSKVLLIHTGGLQGNLSLPSGVLSL